MKKQKGSMVVGFVVGLLVLGIISFVGVLGFIKYSEYSTPARISVLETENDIQIDDSALQEDESIRSEEFGDGTSSSGEVLITYRSYPGPTRPELRFSSTAVPARDCNNIECFRENFSTCQPATIVSQAIFSTAAHKIIEPTEAGCRIEVKYLESSLNLDWENKIMSCSYDNTISFEDSFQKIFDDGLVGCAGPLYDYILSQE